MAAFVEPATRGRSIHIFDGQRQLNVTAVTEVLRSVQDTPIACISVSGLARYGKSLLLDLILSHLRHRAAEAGGPWTSAAMQAQHLDGFDWGGRSRRLTVGIWMWSEPIRIGNVALILLDTQGSFDGEASFADDALIFGISSWLSSLFIYNVPNNLTDDKLQFLEYFIDFSNCFQPKFVTEGGSASAPNFQHLLFLVRDWASPTDFSFGWHRGESGGGSQRNFTTEFIRAGGAMDSDLVATRREIVSNFGEVSSFLLPHPGLDFVNNSSNGRAFGGTGVRIEANHLEQIDALVNGLFATSEGPGSMARMIGGRLQTGRELLGIVETFGTLLANGEIPRVLNLHQSRAQIKLQMGLNRLEKLFHSKMIEIVGRGLREAQFTAEYRRIRDEFLRQFREKFPREDPHQLQETMDESKQRYEQFNGTKRAEREQKLELERIEQEQQNVKAQLLEKDAKFQELQEAMEAAAQVTEEQRRAMEVQLAGLTAQLGHLREHGQRMEESRQTHIQSLEQLALAAAKQEPQIIQPNQKGGILGFLGGVVQAVTSVGQIISVVRGFGFGRSAANPNVGR